MRRLSPYDAPATHSLLQYTELDEATPQAWTALKDRARSTVLARPKGIGVDDLDQRVKFEVCYTQQNWQILYNDD